MTVLTVRDVSKFSGVNTAGVLGGYGQNENNLVPRETETRLSVLSLPEFFIGCTKDYGKKSASDFLL